MSLLSRHIHFLPPRVLNLLLLNFSGVQMSPILLIEVQCRNWEMGELQSDPYYLCCAAPIADWLSLTHSSPQQ